MFMANALRLKDRFANVLPIPPAAADDLESLTDQMVDIALDGIAVNEGLRRPPMRNALALLSDAAAIAGAARLRHRRGPRRHPRLRATSRPPRCDSAPRSAAGCSSCRSGRVTAVKAGEVVAQLDTTDPDHDLARAGAELDAADARLRLLLAGSRKEDIQRAEAELARAEADLAGAVLDLNRLEGLADRGTATLKARDDARTRKAMLASAVAAGRARARRS